jgi:hypothetical protein
MGQSYGPRRIFLPTGSLLIFCPVWPYPGQTLCSAPRRQAPAWQASPWEHRPSPSAPCVVPMRLSRVDQHIKHEPCAKQRALLGGFLSRFSSISRGVRSACSICFFTPLVESVFWLRTTELLLPDSSSTTNAVCTTAVLNFVVVLDTNPAG